ncbi:trypsin-3-like isoform X1 [Megachile rotundata]|uniref:trypsin-3-like isoform X1 n=1 Tax=Megachile rotundata TaxID=143995 RepID=UPI0006153B0B|nr:PREDICTED: trypsin-3-like isoform X2 [Megachile rotundata]
MSSLIILFAIVAVASASNPYVGYPVPFYPNYTNGPIEATRNQFPYQVSLQWGINKLTHFCSGAILSASWVLTSAHCASVVPPYGDFVVKTGKLDLTVTENAEQTATVKQVIIHENYTGDSGLHDVALLKLSKPILLNGTAKAIALSTTSSPSGSGRMLSWGSNWRMYTPRMPDKLQASNLNTLVLSTCQNLLNNITSTTPRLSGYQFCTGSLPGGFSACDSEPGAPFIQYYGSNGPYLMGVSSWGVVPCAISNAPIIFTHLYYYKSWITSQQAAN